MTARTTYDRILVLPFEVEDDRSGAAWRGTGMMDELIERLGAISGLQPESRTTSTYVAAHIQPVRRLMETYGIDWVLRGRIVDDRRLVAHLYGSESRHAMADFHIDMDPKRWTSAAGELVRQLLPHILSARGSSAAALEERLRGQTFGDERMTREREYYRQGILHWHRYTHEEMRVAVGLFQRALDEAPDFAAAYAAMADCYTVIGTMGYEPPRQAFRRAHEKARRALELDDARSESYVSMALVHLFHGRDLGRAASDLQQALQLNPTNEKAQHAMAMLSIHRHALDDAEVHAADTLAINPLSIPHYAMMVRIQLYRKAWEDAMDWINAAMSIEEEVPAIVELRGFLHLLEGKIDAAITDFRFCVDAAPTAPLARANLALALGRAGLHDRMREQVRALDRLPHPRDTGIHDYAMGLVELGRGNLPAAIHHLESAVSSGLGMVPGELRCNALFDPLRPDERFQALLVSCGVAEGVPIRGRQTSLVTLATLTSEELRIDPQDIVFVQADDNYCTVVHTGSGHLERKLLRVTLAAMERQLAPFKRFVRVHRSFLVNVEQAFRLEGSLRSARLVHGALPDVIPVSRHRYERVREGFKRVK